MAGLSGRQTVQGTGRNCASEKWSSRTEVTRQTAALVWLSESDGGSGVAGEEELHCPY